MRELTIKSQIWEAQTDELSKKERELVKKAIDATERSYAPYSRFSVGAALMLRNGEVIIGCNQENAAFPAGICAERAAIYSAGAQYPDEPIMMLAIAARNDRGELQQEPVPPCGICRQVLLESETRFNQSVRLLLYGQSHVYIVDGVKELMPLSFTEF
jgi:cytidine deaminase